MPNIAFNPDGFASAYLGAMGDMKKLFLVALFLCSSVAPVLAQPDEHWSLLIDAVRLSHIEANVPSPDVADSYLQRDLLAYFRQSGASSVVYAPLRYGPTQTGIAYPKFFFWVRVFAGETLVTEGAVSVAAVEKTHFIVKNFLPCQDIRSDPGRVDQVFPAALVNTIRQRAAQ